MLQRICLLPQNARCGISRDNRAGISNIVTGLLLWWFHLHHPNPFDDERAASGRSKGDDSLDGGQDFTGGVPADLGDSAVRPLNGDGE